jgi:hypothetical protein
MLLGLLGRKRSLERLFDGSIKARPEGKSRAEDAAYGWRIAIWGFDRRRLRL